MPLPASGYKKNEVAEKSDAVTSHAACKDDHEDSQSKKFSLLHGSIDNNQFDEFKEQVDNNINDYLTPAMLQSLLSRALTEILIKNDDRFARCLVSVYVNAETYADTPEIKNMFAARPSLETQFRTMLSERNYFKFNSR